MQKLNYSKSYIILSIETAIDDLLYQWEKIVMT